MEEWRAVIVDSLVMGMVNGMRYYWRILNMIWMSRAFI